MAMNELFKEALKLLNENLDAWEGEEDSVQIEHKELIDRTREFIVGLPHV